MEKEINHFSHEHPLQLSLCQQTHTAFSCSGCKLSLFGSIYTCKLCNYSLHISCSQALQLIQHPADPKHPLTLRTYTDKSRCVCDACRHPVTGLSYTCSTCNLDFHIPCVSIPFSVCHDAHDHPLQLAFFPPYQGKSFGCDICGNIGSKQWVYRCAMCSFDAHTCCVGHGQCAWMKQPLEPATAATPPQNINAMAGAAATVNASGIQQNYHPQTGQSKRSKGVRATIVQGLISAAAGEVVKSLLSG